MLQQDEPEDYVIATGVQHSVREFIEEAVKFININITWKGEGNEEQGYDPGGNCIVVIDPRYYRPTEVDALLGDPSKAKEKLGWEPKVAFKELIKEMMESDLEHAKKDALVKKHGYKVLDQHE